MLWSNECKVQDKMSSHILKKSPIALTYSSPLESGAGRAGRLMGQVETQNIPAFTTVDKK